MTLRSALSDYFKELSLKPCKSHPEGGSASWRGRLKELHSDNLARFMIGKTLLRQVADRSDYFKELS